MPGLCLSTSFDRAGFNCFKSSAGTFGHAGLVEGFDLIEVVLELDLSCLGRFEDGLFSEITLAEVLLLNPDVIPVGFMSSCC